MTQLASAAWLPTLLLVLLFCLSGGVPLRGPSTVTGTVGESLSVKCQYEEEFKTNDKYWCRESPVLRRRCSTGVMTRSSKEARNGRMSIRDHPDNLTFTVTLENLTMEDAGTYLCLVGMRFTMRYPLLIDGYFRVVVSVVPGSIPGNNTNTLGSPTTSPVHTQSSVTTEDTIPGSSLQPRSLLSSLSFQILMFLKLPLLLSMLSAVLWVSRPLRCSGKKQHWPD